MLVTSLSEVEKFQFNSVEIPLRNISRAVTSKQRTAAVRLIPLKVPTILKLAMISDGKLSNQHRGD